MTDFEYSYEHVSGPSFDDAFFVGLRFEQEVGYQPEESECWIMSVRKNQVGEHPYELRCQGGTISTYTGIWRSDSGTAYISDMSGQLHSNPDLWDPDAPWGEHRVNAPLSGIWGLSDDCIFAWGGTNKQGFDVFRWNGSAWTAMPRPGLDVRSIHGLSEDLLYAVGIGGKIARWDGNAWHEQTSPVGEDLKSVFVAASDEIYAVGSRGSVLEGSGTDWGVIASAPMGDIGMALWAVAKWNGELWLAGGPQGLFRRVGTTSEIELFKPKVKATAFDARQGLVMASDQWIVGSPDGESFTGVGNGMLTQLRDGHELGDLG